MKKLLFVIDDLGSGGAQRQLINLSLIMIRKGYDISFLIYHPEYFWLPILDKHEIVVQTVLNKNKILRFFKMRALIRKGQYDSVISYLQTPNLISELATFPKKSWTLVVSERSSNPKISKSLALRSIRLLHSRADYVVANSHSNLNLVIPVKTWLRRADYSVIYNLIDTDYWYPKANFKFRSGDVLKLVVCASHQKLKNASGLLRALDLMPLEYKRRIKIDWYGGFRNENFFKETEDLMKSLELQEIVTFYGEERDILGKYQDADAVGLFSYYEGMPNVICEAMSCGKPVVVSEVSDLPDIISDGQNGFLCDPHSTESIKLALMKLLDSSIELLCKMGELNRDLALELFEQEKIANQYIELLENE